jgi:hypothetical protein
VLLLVRGLNVPDRAIEEKCIRFVPVPLLAGRLDGDPLVPGAAMMYNMALIAGRRPMLAGRSQRSRHGFGS